MVVPLHLMEVISFPQQGSNETHKITCKGKDVCQRKLIALNLIVAGHVYLWALLHVDYETMNQEALAALLNTQVK